jgi:ribosome biogenesis GTPase A
VLVLSDIRHPVIHFPPALYKHVVEEMGKELVFVLNKVDLVTPVTVAAWQRYFGERFPKLHIACFTSYPNDQPQSIEDVFHKKRVRTKRKRQMARGAEQVLAACEECMVQKHGEVFQFNEWRQRIQPQPGGAPGGDDNDDEDEDEDGTDRDDDQDSDDDGVEVEAPELGVLGDEEHAPHMDYVTIGFVGNPNVGKSSLLNGLVGKKVVSTSRTPGHTKHFQTIFLSKNIRLCDSPGLVFPSCVPKQLQVLAGIYPVAQVREPFTAIGYLAQRIPLVDTLRLQWPYDDDEYDADKQWSAWAICDGACTWPGAWRWLYLTLLTCALCIILTAWAKKRGYVTAKAARLDTYRAANSLLRLAVDGRIVLSIKPPGFYERLDAEQAAAEEVRAHEAMHGAEGSEGSEGSDDEGHTAAPLRETYNPFALLDDTHN